MEFENQPTLEERNQLKQQYKENYEKRIEKLRVPYDRNGQTIKPKKPKRIKVKRTEQSYYKSHAKPLDFKFGIFWDFFEFANG